MAESYTDMNGDFVMQGSTHELTNIDPVCKVNCWKSLNVRNKKLLQIFKLHFFQVYHDCDDMLPGQRKVKFKIPDSYITRGGTPQRIFDLGTLNLETIFPKEERDLL